MNAQQYQSVEVMVKSCKKCTQDLQISTEVEHFGSHHNSTEIMTSRVLATSVVAVLTCALVWAKSKKKKMEQEAVTPPFDGIPLAPQPHWLFGHILNMNKDNDFRVGQHEIVAENADKDGVCSFWFLGTPAVSILLGRDVKAILNASSRRYQIAFFKVHNDAFLGPKALVSLTGGRDWKFYRKIVHKAFTAAALKSSQKDINFVGETLSKSLQQAIAKSDGNCMITEILSLMKMATIDVFGLSALGIDLNCCSELKPSPIAKAFDFLTDEYSRRFSRPWDLEARLYGLPTKANRRHAQEKRVLRTFLSDLIGKGKQKIASNAPDDTKKNNLLMNLLSATANAVPTEDNNGVTDDILMDMLMVLLFGGYDTTSITLSYALYLLATHPGVQALCVKEVQSVLGKPTFDGPDDLPYTRAVILETLRLYPPAPVTMRNLEKPMDLHGKMLPAKTVIYVPIWSIHRDARNFPQPNDFRPDRWVAQNGTTWVERSADDSAAVGEIAPANRDAFCAFSGGARNCVGRVLAMQEAVTLLAFLVKDLKFETVPEYKLVPKLSSFVQKPDDDLPMKISCR